MTLDILMRLPRLIFLLLLLITACVPKEEVVLRNIKDVVVDASKDGNARLTAHAIFYNPNPVRMKLKEINVEVMVEGKKSAHTKQRFDSLIPAEGEFSIPLEVQLSLKDIGLLDTLLGLFGGKKYQIHYQGYVRVKVHGITLKVPIAYNDEIKLKW